MFKNLKLPVSLTSVFLFLAAVLTAATTFAPLVTAVGETYTWKDYKTVNVSGGYLVSPGTIFLNTPDLPNSLQGSGVFTLYDGSDRVCRVMFNVTFAADYRSVQLQGFRPGTGAGSGGKPTLCNDDDLNKMRSFEGTRATISNARPGANQTPENSDQRKVNVQLYKSGDPTGAPASVKFTLKKAGSPDRSFSSNRSITDNQASYYGTFQNVLPGTYTVCADQIDRTCQTFEKRLHVPVTLVFGEQNSGRVINVKIDFNAVISDPSQEQKFGPFKITLYKADGTTIVQQKEVAFEYKPSSSCQTFGNCAGGARHFLETVTFSNVPPGEYKVCYGSKCVNATKVANVPLTVDLAFNQNDVDATDGKDEPVCQGGAMGWVVCPIMRLVAGANDAIFSLVERQLYIDPVAVEYNGPLYKTWAVFRDIANVAFVLAFIVVVYSQATGAGLSSYGVKKMLPRIIATAILVNISFFLCQIALDISNIIGKSLGDVLEGIKNGSNANVDVLSWDSLIGTLIAAGAVFGVYTAAAGVSGGAAAAALLLPFAVTALFAVLTAIVVLVARQAILILLIAVAPIAFVAFILPNTAKYFERWRELFVTMLLLYPMVALLFGGSQLAAWIIMDAGSNGSETSPLVILTALMIMFLPLFGVPLLLKFSGGLLGRIGAMVNNPNKGPFDSLRKKAEGYRDYRAELAKGRARRPTGLDSEGNPIYSGRGRRVRRNDRIEAIREGAKYQSDRNRQEYIGNLLGGTGEESDQLRQGVAGGGRTTKVLGRQPSALNRSGMYKGVFNEATGEYTPAAGMSDAMAMARARGEATLDKLQGEELSALQTVIKNANFSQEEQKKLATDGIGTNIDGKVTLQGDAYQKAMASMFIDQGRTSIVEDILVKGSQNGTLSSGVRSFLTYKIQTTHSTLKQKGHHLNDDVVKEALLQGRQITDAELNLGAAKQTANLSPEYLSTQERPSLEHLEKAINGGLLSAEQTTKVRQALLKALTSESQRNFTGDTIQVAARIVDEPVEKFRPAG